MSHGRAKGGPHSYSPVDSQPEERMLLLVVRGSARFMGGKAGDQVQGNAGQRTCVHFEDAFAHLLDAYRNAITMHRLQRRHLQNEHAGNRANPGGS
jgi:hypothetical protein